MPIQPLSPSESTELLSFELSETTRPDAHKIVCSRTAFQIAKLVISTAVGVNSIFLYAQEGGRLVTRYLGGNEFVASMFSGSCVYANLFLSIYATSELIGQIAPQQLLPKLNRFKKNRASYYCKKVGSGLLIVVLSSATALPIAAPVKDITKQILTFFSNAIINYYAFSNFFEKTTLKSGHSENDSLYLDFKNRLNYLTYIITQHGSLLQIHNNLITNSCDRAFWDYFYQLDYTDHAKRASKVVGGLRPVQIANVTLSLVCLTPYFLTLFVLLQDPGIDAGVLNYIKKPIGDQNFMMAIFVALFSLLPLALLATRFSWDLVPNVFHFVDSKTHLPVAKKFYPKIYATTNVVQAVGSSLSWATAVKLFLDYCFSDQSIQYSSYHKAGIYLFCILIALGIYGINLFPNLQFADQMLSHAIRRFGKKPEKKLSDFFDRLHQIDDQLKKEKKDHPSRFSTLLGFLQGDVRSLDNAIEITEIPPVEASM